MKVSCPEEDPQLAPQSLLSQELSFELFRFPYLVGTIKFNLFYPLVVVEQKESPKCFDEFGLGHRGVRTLGCLQSGGRPA